MNNGLIFASNIFQFKLLTSLHRTYTEADMGDRRRLRVEKRAMFRPPQALGLLRDALI